MRVTRLKLSNVRPIEAAEFRFRPDFNLVAGVNGVGKTTVLKALVQCLRECVASIDSSIVPPAFFKVADIRVGAEALDVECDVEYGGGSYHHVTHRGRHDGGSGSLEHVQKSGGSVAVNEGRLLPVFFSTMRAVPSARSPRKKATAGGMAAVLDGALLDRHLELAKFTAWMRTRKVLARECAAKGRVLQVLDETVRRFLPGYGNLRPDEEDRALLIDRGGVTIPVGWLSDGERGVLALVLDLARLLSQANPELDDPTSDAGAVVLIDELELHLHPAWQRRIMENLTKAFRRCQFIATTHSPQVIGEIQHNHVHVMADGEVYSPSHSFGVDSSRVLEEIMDTVPRTAKVVDLLGEISGRIDRDEFDGARGSLAELTKELGEDDPEVIRLRTLLDFMEGN